MKLKLSSQRGANHGHVLFAALSIMFVAGVAIMSYLGVIQNRLRLTGSSQSWNVAMPVAEAGVEEAMAHLNYTAGNNLNANGWLLTSKGYQKQVFLDGADYYYITTISTNAMPTIESAGYVRAADSSRYVSRIIQARTTQPPQFVGAIVSKRTIDLNANKATIDSFDSSSNLKSTNGKYDPAKRGEKGDVVLGVGGIDFSVGNLNIWGHAYTSSGVTISTGPNGAIGDLLWNLLGSGVKPGWWINTSKVTVPDVVAPFTTGATPGSGSVDGVTYDYALQNGRYVLSELTGKCIITGNAELYVKGNIDASVLTVKSNASVKIFCAGKKANFNEVNNQATSVALKYFGLPTNTDVDFGSSWVGAIYAPSADFTITGNRELSGSVVANNIRVRGNAKIHYDEALAGKTSSATFEIAGWDEL